MPRTARKQGKTGVYYITLHNSKSHTENRPLYDCCMTCMTYKEKVMDRIELIKLVERIMRCEGTDEEQDELLELLEKNVLDPQVSNYIFYEENTPEEVIDKALTYTPIILEYKNE